MLTANSFLICQEDDGKRREGVDAAQSGRFAPCDRLCLATRCWVTGPRALASMTTSATRSACAAGQPSVRCRLASITYLHYIVNAKQAAMPGGPCPGPNGSPTFVAIACTGTCNLALFRVQDRDREARASQSAAMMGLTVRYPGILMPHHVPSSSWTLSIAYRRARCVDSPPANTEWVPQAAGHRGTQFSPIRWQGAHLLT
jgi:hypothetical protein